MQLPTCQEIIKINQNAAGIQTVNARELHAFLEVGKDFSTWIKDRIHLFQFEENTDFVCSPILVSEGRGGHNRIDYHLTIDMAKELSMVERTEKGKQARLYFIDCERRAKQLAAIEEDPAMQMARGLLAAAAMIEERNTKIAELEPKAAALDRIANADGLTCMTTAAKIIGVRPRQFIQHLHAHRWIYRRGGRWVGHEDKVRQGLVDHKYHAIIDHHGDERQEPQVYLTPKGVAKLTVLLGQGGAA